ncbi:MAG: hypothetical protein ACTSP4_13705 [Candidatus Hodarchaeales archaeon]
MKAFIDCCYLVSLLNERDEKHADSKRILNLIVDEEYGPLYTTDFILNEVLNLIWNHLKGKDIVSKAFKMISRTPDFITLECYDKDLIDIARDK